jgi:hypothetical protein
LPADSRAPTRDRGSPDYGVGGRNSTAAADLNSYVFPLYAHADIDKQ